MPVAKQEETTPRVPRVSSDRELTKLARENEIIVVRNTQPNIVVFVPDSSSQDKIELAAKGDPKGEDVVELPSEILKNAQFRKILMHKIIEIIDADSDEVLDAVEAQQRAWAARTSAREETDQMISAQQPRAYSGTQCLAQEGRAQCSEFAISSQNTREKPPLCSKHAHLASQFVPEENGQFQDGKPVVQWNRVSTF